ncbi:hypothetical protein L226DRAFT_576638 [Lentinus tigrinus ALCF2SS1-7]|uniref:uncharacterized protein n=1 Tax=Lentinus tigrinus ALCF2SS1-7 TaxID=1328758 RepID=UPI001165DB41|nr:hypothetical protein L226DRAFT_576638 [Lentinus tigrinus ALCF2SS1-7]
MWLLSALSLREWDGTMGYIELKPTIYSPSSSSLLVPRQLVLAAPSSATDLHPLRMRCSECQVHGGGPDSSIAERVGVDVDYTNTDVKNNEATFTTLKLSAHEATAVGAVTGRAILC